MSKKTKCEGCGRMAAGGGQRYCWACLCDVLGNEPLGSTEKRQREERNAYKRKVYGTAKKCINIFTFA